MKLFSIQSRLGALFLAFALLVITSVAVMYRGIIAQQRDALVINLAGRQRMLVQQMTRLALEAADSDYSQERQAYLAELQTAQGAFDKTLQALHYGGPAPYSADQQVELPAAQDEDILAHLAQVATTWEAFQAQLALLVGEPPGTPAFEAAARSIQEQAPALMTQVEAAVHLYEISATQKVERLRWLQAGFLLSAALLLGLGWWTVHVSILRPLQALYKAAGRIGQGDLQTPVDGQGLSEVGLLGQTLETMRSQLLDSQHEVQVWTGSLEERVAQRTRELEALAVVTREIASHLELDRLLCSVTEKARQLLGSEIASLCLIDEDGRVLRLHAASGPYDAVQEEQAPIENALAGQILHSDKALACSAAGCIGSDAAGNPAAGAPGGFCRMLAPDYRVSHLAAPLRAGRQVIGALCVGSSQPDAFPVESHQVLMQLASAAAVAIENARLYGQAEYTAVLEERQRMAAEIHDGLAQTLSFVQIMIDMAHDQAGSGQTEQACTTLGRSQQVLQQATQEARQAISNLKQVFPRQHTLQKQIETLIAELSTRKRDFPGEQLCAEISFQSQVKPPVMLPQADAEQVLRVVQEALLNACKYAQAERITVRLEQTDIEALQGDWCVTVEDDGQGFNPAASAPQDGRRHFGLSIMRARAERLGGRLDLQAVPGEGTCLALFWPKTRDVARVVEIDRSRVSSLEEESFSR